jgi:hypothetical protein
VPVHLNAHRHESGTEAQMSCVGMVFAPVAKSGSGATYLECGANIGRAAWMNHGDIRQMGPCGRGRVTSMSDRTCRRPAVATSMEVLLGSVRALQSE